MERGSQGNVEGPIILGLAIAFGIHVVLYFIGWFDWWLNFAIKYLGSILLGVILGFMMLCLLSVIWGICKWAFYKVRRATRKSQA